LKSFKAYLYHPDYLGTVPHGFQSLSFVNKINPEVPICDFEVDGGVCNDPMCKRQHFRDMGLTDDQLILLLGTSSPAQSEDQKAAWSDGIKATIAELRSQNIKQPQEIAAKILEFRRKFLGDPSRVLNLGSFNY